MFEKENKEDQKIFFIDSHAHLSMRQFKDDLDEVIQSAKRAQVQKILTVALDFQEARQVLSLCQKNPELLVQFLTHYSVLQGDMVVKRWIELGEFLITKYNDGYVKDDRGRPRGMGYPSEWLRIVLESKPMQFKIPQWKNERKE